MTEQKKIGGEFGSIRASLDMPRLESYLKENVKEIVQMIIKYFPQKDAFKDVFGLFGAEAVQGAVVEGFNEAVAKPFEAGAVKGLIHTKVGDGPRVLSADDSLLGHDGIPKTLA